MPSQAAYTYDAGPNCVVYAPKRHMEDVIALAHHFFPPKNNEVYYRGIITSAPQPPRKELLDAVKIPVHEVGTLYLVSVLIGSMFTKQ